MQRNFRLMEQKKCFLQIVLLKPIRVTYLVSSKQGSYLALISSGFDYVSKVWLMTSKGKGSVSFAIGVAKHTYENISVCRHRHFLITVVISKL